MVALGMAGFVIGFASGLRFRVLVLLPIEAVALMVAAMTAFMNRAEWGSALLGFATFCVSSQVSYAISLVLPTVFRPSSI